MTACHPLKELAMKSKKSKTLSTPADSGSAAKSKQPKKKAVAPTVRPYSPLLVKPFRDE
jgi:hypothetical protein